MAGNPAMCHGVPKQPGWQQKNGRPLRDLGLVLRQLEEKLGAIQN
jgi:hypothetical protein